ncbi:hypothetical protein MUG84_13895 [Paenibacillus sp. KQZ6P-2]|uniref:Immunity MXAN-0049 protein domain-containing protein n=1 Tax=Paenibacillus mangrovi TaxID=2931978 RepID=A0A9X2B3B9_9BACL|nr:DUF1629 domain-containing protein [Paenibacillus mangrovi]MCJ8012825.1 hypothetical protein [Paenibacillus mangrovi]
MKVYRWINNENVMILRYKNDLDNDHPIFTSFNGDSVLGSWTPFELITFYKKKYKDIPLYDSGMPVVSRRVRDIIEPYVANEVEFLPLIHEELELYMINVTNIIDCVDYDRSEVLLSVGKMAGFTKIVFDFSKIPSETYLFKIREMAETKVFLTQAFKEIIESHKIKDLDFSDDYDSKFTKEMQIQQQQQYEAALTVLENYQGHEFSYEEAISKIDAALAVETGKWRMQRDEKGRLWLGQLKPDLNYLWMRPMYIPPMLLGYRWHEIERSII